jgi:hypothetical protein
VYRIKELQSGQSPTKGRRAIDKCDNEENYYFVVSWGGGLFHEAVSASGYITSNGLMDNEMKMVWNEALIA